MLQDLQITIIGAGIAGLSAALALKQKGFSHVHILERAESLSEIGAGLQLGPNAVRALACLGLGDQLKLVSNSCPLGEIHSGEVNKNTYLGDLPLSEHSLTAYGQPCYQLLRSDLQRILYKAVTDAGVDIQLNSDVEAIEFSDDLANIAFSDGTKRSSELVVVADGIGSKISAQIFPNQALTYSGFACWRGLIDREKLGDDWVDQVRVYTGEDRHLVAYPVANSTKLNLVATTKHPSWSFDKRARSSSTEEWLNAYSGWSDEVLDLISKVDEPQLWALYERQSLPSWSVSRAIVIGDAAHPMLPSLAQGAAQAIEDSIEFAEILGASQAEKQQFNDPNYRDSLLAKLYQRRHQRVSRVQKASQWNLNYFHQPAGLYRAIRNRAMKIAGPIASRLISSRYDWLYADNKET